MQKLARSYLVANGDVMACCGGLFWWPVLAACFGGLFGRPVLAARLGGLFWFNETINTNAMHTCEMTGTYLRSCSLL